MNPKQVELNFTDVALHSFSQIFLQENRMTGILFLVGIFLGNWQYGLAALLAVLFGNLTALVLKFDRSNLNAGIYGFSAALVGVVLPFLFETTALIWLLIVLGGILATLLQEFFIRIKIPGYTFPFIFMSWVLYFMISQFTNTTQSEIVQWGTEANGFEYLLLGTKGYGQVIFQGGILVGILFFVGVTINNPIAGIYALLSSFVGAGLAYLFSFPMELISIGLFGFNPVLTAIVFAGKKYKDGLWVLIGVVLTFFIQLILLKTDLLKAFGGVFTFPFVAATWLTLILQKFTIQKEIE